MRCSRRRPLAGAAADGGDFDADAFDGEAAMTTKDELELIDEALGALRDAPPDSARPASNGM